MKSPWRQRLALWLFVHFLRPPMEKDPAFAADVFGRTLNLFLLARGWELKMDGTAGLRWSKWTTPAIRNTVLPLTALQHEFLSGGVPETYTFIKPLAERSRLPAYRR